MDREIWKNVEGLNGLLQVSNLGNARRYYLNGRKPQQLKLKKTEKGYLRAVFRIDYKVYMYRVHRLVAQAFIPNPNNLPQVNHKDGNKINNCVDNLEWVTDHENKVHANTNGLYSHKKCHYRKIAMLVNGIEIKRFTSIANAAREMNLTYDHICYQLMINKNHPKDRHIQWVYL